MDMTKTDRRPLREEQLRVFLLEDLGYGDITSEALISPEQRARARLFFKEPGVAAGLEEASVIFTMLGCEVKHLERDGNWVPPGKVLLEFDGSARSLLLGERVALNLVSHMAGIATATAEVVEKVRKTSPSTRVAATRKTTPGLKGSREEGSGAGWRGHPSPQA